MQISIWLDTFLFRFFSSTSLVECLCIYTCAAIIMFNFVCALVDGIASPMEYQLVLYAVLLIFIVVFT